MLDDDEINEMLKSMKDSGVRERQIMVFLELLWHAEELNVGLRKALTPLQIKDVQKTIIGALLKIFGSD